MRFSVRLSYPENNEYSWDEALQGYTDIGNIELAFYSTELFLRNVRLEDILDPFRKIPTEVSSIHMAHVGITDFPLFELVFKRTVEIAKEVRCRYIVVHPSKGSLDEVIDFIENTITPVLNHEKIFLCWETFASKKRFLSGVNGIGKFCHGRQWHRICYDFSHIHSEQDVVIKEVSKYLEYIKVFHLSNRISSQNIQHLPIFHSGGGKLDLDFLPILRFLKEKDYSGIMVLEYLPEFHSQLIEDALFLKNKFGSI